MTMCFVQRLHYFGNTQKNRRLLQLCVPGLSSCFSADKLIKANVQLEESIPCIASFKSHIIF